MAWSGTISGDIIAYTSLSQKSKEAFDNALSTIFDQINALYKAYTRSSTGDFIEVVVAPKHVLRCGLMIKTYVKSLDFKDFKDKGRGKLFSEYGVRLAMGVGELERVDIVSEVIDGEAIYRTGRKVSSYHTYGKKRVSIKQTMFFVSGLEEIDKDMDVILSLADQLINQASAKQCRVVYHKLCGLSEVEIAELLEIDQSGVNRHASAAGWYALQKAVDYYEKQIFTQNFRL